MAAHDSASAFSSRRSFVTEVSLADEWRPPYSSVSFLSPLHGNVYHALVVTCGCVISRRLAAFASIYRQPQNLRKPTRLTTDSPITRILSCDQLEKKWVEQGSCRAVHAGVPVRASTALSAHHTHRAPTPARCVVLTVICSVYVIQDSLKAPETAAQASQAHSSHLTPIPHRSPSASRLTQPRTKHDMSMTLDG